MKNTAGRLTLAVLGMLLVIVWVFFTIRSGRLTGPVSLWLSVSAFVLSLGALGLVIVFLLRR